MGYTRATHGIVVASYFYWHEEEDTTNRLETENMEQFFRITYMLAVRRWHQAQPQHE